MKQNSAAHLDLLETEHRLIHVRVQNINGVRLLYMWAVAQLFERIAYWT